MVKRRVRGHGEEGLGKLNIIALIVEGLGKLYIMTLTVETLEEPYIVAVAMGQEVIKVGI